MTEPELPEPMQAYLDNLEKHLTPPAGEATPGGMALVAWAVRHNRFVLVEFAKHMAENDIGFTGTKTPRTMADVMRDAAGETPESWK